MGKFMDFLKHGVFNSFDNEEQKRPMAMGSYGATYGSRPDRNRLNVASDKSIVSSIYTRIGIDVASVRLKHVQFDENEQYVKDIPSKLNYCLTQEANIDQVAFAFRQDMAMSLFDKGTIAVVAVDTTLNPNISQAFDVETMRVGEIVHWMPKHVRVLLYNDNTGKKEELTLDKRNVAIVENPLYNVMNEPSSTLQRLIRKLGYLDAVDEQASSGKLDLIIQLPYVVKTETKRAQAEQRRKDIEVQMTGSKYGIAYTDGSEKITQLNRPVENNMLAQVEYLTGQLYAQLGLTKEVFDGTATEAVMLNYFNRTVEPILVSITESLSRAFLSKTARTQRHRIHYIRDAFKLVPVTSLADMADKFTRNEVLSTNEIRSAMGMKPSKDPKADALVNPNMPQPNGVTGLAPVVADGTAVPVEGAAPADQEAVMTEAFDSIEKTVDDILAGIES